MLTARSWLIYAMPDRGAGAAQTTPVSYREALSLTVNRPGRNVSARSRKEIETVQITQQLTKAQKYSVDMLCQAIRRIEELVPKEEKRSSDRHKKQLINAYLSLDLHCRKLEIGLPEQASIFYRPQFYLEQVELCASVLTACLAPIWQPCEKVTLTRARQFTEEDYERCAGRIQTREGMEHL
jgi:hypothetical protein